MRRLKNARLVPTAAALVCPWFFDGWSNGQNLLQLTAASQAWSEVGTLALIHGTRPIHWCSGKSPFGHNALKPCSFSSNGEAAGGLLELCWELLGAWGRARGLPAASWRLRSNGLHDHPRHAARTNTNTSAATTIQINAFCGSGGGRRGASLMALPEASWLRWSNLKCRNEAQGPKGAEGPYDRCCGHLRPCCARAASSRLIRSSTSLWS